jgi:hypothetical protein
VRGETGATGPKGSATQHWTQTANLDANGVPATIPGLSGSVATPSRSMVFVLASGNTTNTATGGTDKTLEVVVYVDNVATSWKQQVQVPASTSRSWQVLGAVSLPAGTSNHVVTIKTNLIGSGTMSVGPSAFMTVTALQ